MVSRVGLCLSRGWGLLAAACRAVTAAAKVVPTLYPNMTPSAPILALESKGSPN